MDQNLFSESLIEYTGQIDNVALTESIDNLKEHLGIKNLKLFQWNDTTIAVASTMVVDLPPLGNFQNLDIRDREPILITLSLENYPEIPPIVFPDRLDFPKNNLAHLYVARNNKPPAFCIIRGSRSDWYSNKRLKDLYIRTGNWLRDAAAGVLSEDGNQFDPTRMESPTGMMIYDYDQVATIINKKESFIEGVNFAAALFERNVSEHKISFKLTKPISNETFTDTLQEFNKEKEKSNNIASKKYYHFGYILWAEGSATYKKYNVNIPENWNSFKNFCDEYGINTSFIDKQIAQNDKNVSVLIPVIVGIRRPKKLIGFEGDIEFINFTLRVDTDDVANESIVNNIPIYSYTHGQPLSIKKAAEISGGTVDLGIVSLIAGCGALGSKVVMHFARSGATNFLLADPDDLSPHNLVRHAMLGNGEGVNKAELLKKEIKQIYPYENLSFLKAIPSSGTLGLNDEISKHLSWILDFTASNSFSQSLVKAEFSVEIRIARSFITDNGKVGITFFEGKGRNPRIDDLQVGLYSLAENSPIISAWLTREHESSLDGNKLSVTIGVGCNSETTILPDDIVSLHSSYTAAVIKTESTKEQTKTGRVYLNEIRTEPFFLNTPHLLEIPAMQLLVAKNDPSWEIRLVPGILDSIKKEMEAAKPYETGGVFAGCANYKTKTIHVTHLIKAPKDSKANQICFFRGIEGLPETINTINQYSGNQLGYIGEWHSHPEGPKGLSETDANTVRKFKNDFNVLPTPLPVFLLIITPEEILPYVY